MITKNSNVESYYASGIWGKVTLDGLLRKAVQTHPDAIAVYDPLDRARWTDNAPKNWTWTELHLAIEQLSFMISNWKLPKQSRILIFMPNITEQLIAYFACLRAECIPLIVDGLPGEYELRTIGVNSSASAIITVTHFGEMKPALMASNIAFHIPSLRFIVAFGENCPDGVLSLNDILNHPSGNALGAPPLRALSLGIEDKIAYMCTTIISDEQKFVTRTHNQLLAGGMMTYLESQANANEVIIAVSPILSIGSMNAAVVPWLLSQTPLVLHQPFDLGALIAQSIEHEQFRLVIAGRHAHIVNSAENSGFTPNAISYIWSNPIEHLHACLEYEHKEISHISNTTDVVVLNSIAVCAIRREKPAPTLIKLGHHTAPRKVHGSPTFLQIEKSDDSSLVCHGPSVGNFYQDNSDSIDTGLFCHVNNASEITYISTNSRLAYIGGLCVSLVEIEQAFYDHPIIDYVNAKSAPDPIFGERIYIEVTPRTQSLPKNRILTLVEKHLQEYGFSSYKCGAEIVIASSHHVMNAKAS